MTAQTRVHIDDHLRGKVTWSVIKRAIEHVISTDITTGVIDKFDIKFSKEDNLIVLH